MPANFLVGLYFLLGAIIYWALVRCRVPEAAAFVIAFAVGVLFGIFLGGKF